MREKLGFFGFLCFFVLLFVLFVFLFVCFLLLFLFCFGWVFFDNETAPLWAFCSGMMAIFFYLAVLLQTGFASQRNFVPGNACFAHQPQSSNTSGDENAQDLHLAVTTRGDI